MWKLMIFGILVQLVLLVSILDVNLYDGGGGVQPMEKMPCVRSVMVISIEELQYNDVMIAVNRSAAVRELMGNSSTYHVNVSPPNNITNETFTDDNYTSMGSVFDGRKLLYVGPPVVPFHFNTSLWHLILINQKNGSTYNEKNSTVNDTTQLEDLMSRYGSYVVNRRRIVDHMRRIIEDRRTDYFPMKFINIGRSSSSEEFMTEDERVWFFTKVCEVVHNVSKSSNYVFIITSSMRLLVENDYGVDETNHSLLIHGQSQCISDQVTAPFFNDTLRYEDSYNILKSYAVLTMCNIQVPKESKPNILAMDGNILEFIGGKAFEIQKMYMNFGLYFTGWETLDAVLNSLEVVDIEISPLVLAATVFIFFMWISFLSIKTIKLAFDSSQCTEGNSNMMKLLNVLCLILILGLGLAVKISGCPYRYLVYVSIAVIVFRLFCGEMLSSGWVQMECSIMDKVKIGLQLFILLSVVECIFWSTFYKRILFIVFVLAAFGRILQGALSVMKFRTIIAFSLATLFIGVQYLWPFGRLPRLVNVNLSASLWALTGVAAIKLLMEKSNHDRFVMFLCLVELLMALSFTNVFIIYGFSFYSVVPVVGFFAGLSLILPLFGGSDPKNRLLELAVATSAVFVFFSCNGESYFLLSSFILSFSSYLMDRASTKKLNDDDSFYINIFPATFHAVLLILACHIVTPAGGEAIMRAYTLFNMESEYQLVASGILYFMKMAFLVNLLAATFLSSGPKLLALPNLLVVVIILNLISFRAFIQYSMFSAEEGRKRVFINHILMHVVAAMSFYLYPFVQVLCNTNLFSICKFSRSTYIPQEAIN